MQALFYLSPALMDWMLFFVAFAVFYAAGARGVGMQACGWLGILFQVGYMTSSMVSGHFVTQRNARNILLASTLVCGLASAGILCSSAFGLLAAGLLVFGASAAWFFNSFQAFMRGGTAVGSLKTSVAVYTLSWCLGAALGNVTAGGLYQWGLPALLAAVALATTLITLTLLRPAPRSAPEPSHEAPVEQGSRPQYPVCNMCVLGVYAGFVYYCAVYYASNSGRRSFNIGVNEALVGLGSIAGIMLGDGWMRYSGSTSQLYLVCAAGLAVSSFAQLTLALLKPAHPSPEKGHDQSGNGMGLRFSKRTVES